MAVKPLVSDSSGDHLPYTGDDGKPDHHLMGAAWAALHGGYRGNKYDGPDKAKAIEKLKGVYKSEGMDPPGSSSSDHADLTDQWIEIFRAGDYGDKGNYTAADLDHIVRAYNPAAHEAPAVVGHPETNSPAYGWVSAVKREGDGLFVKLDQVNPQFNDMVKSGAFKKRSASFYRKPAGPELRHVGFLGAQPPEVKGLSGIQFEDEFETAEVVFGEGPTMSEQKTVAQEIQAFFAGLFKERGAGPQFNEPEVKSLIDAMTTPLQTKIGELEAKLTAQATSFAEREKKLSAAETSTRAADAIAKLRRTGRWLPAFEKMGLPLVFGELAKHSETVEFGEGDAKKQVAPLDLLVSFMEELPKFVPYTADVFDGVVTSFADAAHRAKTTNLPPQSQNSVQLYELAKARQKEKKVSFGEALSEVAQEHPELTMPAHTSAGAV